MLEPVAEDRFTAKQALAILSGEASTSGASGEEASAKSTRLDASRKRVSSQQLAQTNDGLLNGLPAPLGRGFPPPYLGCGSSIQTFTRSFLVH